MTINPTKNIVSDPKICHGKPVFRGTRVMVWQVLELLQNKVSEKEIFEAYPNLPKNAVSEALKYAAAKVQGTSYVSFGKDQVSA